MNKFQYVLGGTIAIFTWKNLKHWKKLLPKCKMLEYYTKPHKSILDDVKKFSKSYKTELLNSATNDLNYRDNNAYEYMYNINVMKLYPEPIDIETTAVLQRIEMLFAS